MYITITRRDPLANVGTDSHVSGVLSVESFDSWHEVFSSLRARNLPVTTENERAFETQTETYFKWNEFVNLGHSVYLASVEYEVRVAGALTASRQRDAAVLLDRRGKAMCHGGRWGTAQQARRLYRRYGRAAARAYIDSAHATYLRRVTAGLQG